MRPFVFVFGGFPSLPNSLHQAKPRNLTNRPGGKQLVWTLFVDLYCINFDGNLFDVALTAVIAALENGLLLFGFALLFDFFILFFI